MGLFIKILIIHLLTGCPLWDTKLLYNHCSCLPSVLFRVSQTPLTLCHQTTFAFLT